LILNESEEFVPHLLFHSQNLVVIFVQACFHIFQSYSKIKLFNETPQQCMRCHFEKIQ